MKILMLNWRDPKNPKSGGAEIVTLEHAKAWVKAGHEVTWFTSRFKDATKEEIINGIQIIRRGNSFTVYFFAPFYYLFSKNKFDVIIDQIHGVPFLTPLYIKKPKIAFIHEVAEQIWDHTYPFPINKLGKTFEALCLKFYKRIPIWTDAESTIIDLEKYGIKRSYCTAIPCPINTTPLKKLPIKEKNPTFIFVSRIVKMKGIEDVIKAFTAISKDRTYAKLWVIGAGEKRYINKLKDMIKKYSIEKNIHLFGKVSEKKKYQLMRRAHLLLHASIREGWGLVVIEAASQATPSVVYNVSGLRDVVQNGKTGIVLKNNSPEFMAKEALHLLEDKNRYKGFQKKCLLRAKKFKWGDVTAQSLLLLNRLVKET